MKKKITLVCPSLHNGGIERVMTTLADNFVQKGYDVQFLTCIPGNHFFKINPLVNFSEPNQKKINFFHYLKLLWFLRKNIKRFDPISVMVFGDYFCWLVILSLLGTKTNVFIADQMSPTQKFSHFLMLMKRIFYPFAKGVIAQTELSLFYHRKRYGNKLNIRVLPNPINNFEISVGKKEKYVVVVARMHYDKGIDIALDIWSKIVNKNSWKLVFAGGGSQLSQMKSYAKTLGISDDVIFLGEVSDVFSLLSKSQILLLSSRGEGFPNALCEGMAVGLACICFKKLNNKMIITKNEFDGILVDNDNKVQMAEKLYNLMKNEKLRFKLSENAILIKNRLEVNSIAKEYLDFILQ